MLIPFIYQRHFEPEMDIKSFKKELKDYLQRLLSSINDEEVKKAKDDLLANLTFLQDGNDSSLQFFNALASGFTVEELEGGPIRYRT